MVVAPRRATTRTVSASMACSRETATTRPSALLTIFEVMTRMSPVAQVRGGRGDERREVAARRDLGQPGDRHDGNRRSGHYLSSWARSSAARAMAAVAGRSRM